MASASCTICRDCLDDASDCSALACGHVFHQRCVTEWLQQSPTCPQCRRRLRNPQKELLRVFISFGSAGGDQPEGGEPEGLAELRQRLAALASEKEAAAKRLARCQKRDAHMKRQLNQRQREADMYSKELGACQESLAQQAAENSQLMQLLAQDEEQMSEARRLQSLLDEERLAKQRLDARVGDLEQQLWALQPLRAANADLRSRLEDSQAEALQLTEALQDEKSASGDLLGELLTREAELLDLSGRLNSGHGDNSRLARLLSESELRVTQLRERLRLCQLKLLDGGGGSGCGQLGGVDAAASNGGDEFCSLPVRASSSPLMVAQQPVSLANLAATSAQP